MKQKISEKKITESLPERKTVDIFKDIRANFMSLTDLIGELMGRAGAVSKCIALALLINFSVEVLHRQSLYECVAYMHNHMFSFLFNTLIILLTLCVGVVLKRRYFYYMLISVFWLGLGVISAVVLAFRQTPLTWYDFLIARSAVSMFDDYLSKWQIIALSAISVFVVIGLILAFVKAPRPDRINYKQGFGFIGVVIMLLTGSVFYAQNVVYSDSDSFVSLIKAFDDYGFAYSFAVTTFDEGIDEPENYSEKYMLKLKEELDENSVPVPAEAQKSPNIVYLQLESFMDVNYIMDYTYSENPIPNFQKLKADYPSGFLSVPSIGGGTSNTEFEILTGMNMEYFGAGEYPFKTIMQKTTAESICYNLKPHGYTTHAIHNYTGTFYDRHIVYKNLGFDTFTPMEFMYNIEYNAGGWVKDKVLIENIMKALDSSEGKDFVHAVSVQGHGQYPSKKIDKDHTITMKGIDNDEVKFGFEYYINELHDMDKFILDLTNALSAYDEEVILVVWGDHLPTFNIEENQIYNRNLMQTEYVIWSNFGLEAEDKDLHSYEISAHIMKLIGRNDGWLTKFHQTVDYKADDFDEKFSSIEYDLLYGKSYLYNGKKHEPTDIQIGIDKIVVTDAYATGEDFHVKGNNFNAFSVIVVDGKEYDTRILDGQTVAATDVAVKEDSEIYVIQTKKEFGSTNKIKYSKK